MLAKTNICYPWTNITKIKNIGENITSSLPNVRVHIKCMMIHKIKSWRSQESLSSIIIAFLKQMGLEQ